ncbi:MAG: hypothetical protein ACI9EX_001514 [Oleispira sp.]|jgi:hypothetical protein
MRFIAILSVFVLQLVNIHTSQANFAAWDKPMVENSAAQWRVKESDHFVITYPKSNRVMADKALNIAERIHLELVPFFDQTSPQKTQMVLVDDFDYANGWATFFPYAQIRLFSSPPDSINGLEVNDDWLHALIRHEYVHILHLQMARGLPKATGSIFGNIVLALPHSITPSFMLEGLATYLETNHELGYGRLQGSFYRMQMRTEVAAQRLKTLGDVAAPLREWPLGMQYLYGSYFYQFLAEIHGEQSIQDYLNKYSGEAIPAVMQNHAMSSIVGKDFDQLWRDYHQWLIEEFSNEIAVLKNSTQQGKALAIEQGRRGLFKDVSNSQGEYFYFVNNNGEDTPVLTTYVNSDINGKVDDDANGAFLALAKTKDVLALDINQQQDVVASRLITWRDGRSWADVFLLVDGVIGKKWQAITTQSRLRNVRWLNNNLMIASRKSKGISELVLLDKQGNSKSLWRGDDETTVLGDYDISAAGDYMVIAVKRALQGWNLERINFDSKSRESKNFEFKPIDFKKKTALDSIKITSWTMITHTKAIENSPQILADGRILYSADYDGIYNLYLLEDAAQPKVIQLTNMLTGAFEPKLIIDKDTKKLAEIIFQAYTAEGFEMRKIIFNEDLLASLTSFSLTQQQGQYNYPAPYLIEVEKTPSENYQPWSSLAPTWWFPYFSATAEASQIGFQTGGSDVLRRHQYALQLAVDSANELADIGITYRYDNRYQVVFQRTHDYVDVVDDSKPEYIIEQDRWILARNHILNSFEDQLSLNAAIIIEREGTITRNNLLSARCLDANFKRHKTCEKTLAGIGLQFDSRKGYLNSPGFSAGRYLDLVYETNDVLSGLSDSDYRGGILQGQWQEMFDLPGRRSLSLQVIAAQTSKENEAVTIGGGNRLTEINLFGRDDFALRGYVSSVQGGNNMNVNRLNFNQWLGRVDKGWGIWPIAVGDYSANVYVDYGSAWQSGESPNYLTGVGIDFNIEVLAFYNLMMPVRLSFAHGLDDEVGENRASIGISLPY